MRKLGNHSSSKALRLLVVSLCVVALNSAHGLAADESTKSAGAVPPEAMESDEPVTASSIPPLQGKTEMTEVILDDQPLYVQAMAAIENEDYSKAIQYFQQLEAQFGEGHEPYLAECMYFEAGCHQMLKRQNAATDMYKRAFELFEKYDSSNPLKGNAWQNYSALKQQKASMDHGSPLQGGVDLNTLEAAINNRKAFLALIPQKAQFSIDPNAVLAVRDNNRDIPLLEVNDRAVLPKIVRECFSEMNCLETAEIGSNVTNAEGRWMPLNVHGKTAAFGMDGHANPAFRANVNGKSYLFDVILPDMQPGQRKILLVTNSEKICAVDVENFDTWYLRMQRNKDGKIISARWYKLTHKKDRQPFVSPVANPQIRHPASRRNW